MSADLVVIETGEVVETMGRVEAERVTAQIADKLDGIADNIELVMPLIREALTRQAWKALDYNGVSDYVADRFKGSLTRLPRQLRDEVVRELSAAGMSTRAIAPVVGISDRQVRNLTGGQNFPPVGAEVMQNAPCGERELRTSGVSVGTPEGRRSIGTDGKSYPARQAPKTSDAKPANPSKPYVPDTSAKQTGRRIEQDEDHGFRVLTLEQIDRSVYAGGFDNIPELLLHDELTAEEATELLGDLSASIRVLRRVKNLLEGKRNNHD